MTLYNRNLKKLSLFKISVPMFLISLIFSANVVLQVNAQTYPATIKIPVTFYDFHSDGSNPEFEKNPGMGALQLGMVADTLDGQRKPVLGTTPYWNCSIAKWFKPWLPGDFTIPNYANPATTTCGNPFITVNYDTAFKNIVIQDMLVFTLIPGSAGTYQFLSAAFFPLDGKGFGADEPPDWKTAHPADAAHNYSFSMELHWRFVKVPGLTFQFAGDDDVWAFVNNTLAMDIGGIHNTTTGTLDVDYLNLTDGSTYTFDLFYCQRHAINSSIQITTNIVSPPMPQNLSYSSNPAYYLVNVPIVPDTPRFQGGAAVAYSVAPQLPMGLAFNTTTGIISGTPVVAMATTAYRVAAITANGSDTATISMTINEAPRLISAVAINNNPGEGVLLTFDKSAKAFTITPQNINSDFSLSNGHSWLCGFGTFSSAIWNPDSTMLLIMLSNTISPPTIVIGDTIYFEQGQSKTILTGNLLNVIHSCQIKNVAKFSVKAGKNQIIFMIPPDLADHSSIKIRNLSGKLIADFQGSQRTIWNCKGCSAGLCIISFYLKNDLVASFPVVLKL